MRELRKTTCNRDCPDTCRIVATVEDGRVTHLAGDPDHPVTRGFLCYRTSHFLQTQYSPQRLVSPLLREPRSGQLVPVSWTQALDYAAAELLRIRAESGPAAIFHYHSAGSLGLLGKVVDSFFERFGPVTVKRGDICSGAGDYAQMTDFGDEDSNDVFDLLNAKNIILWGKNVFVSSPHLIPILRQARERGARLCLIDPVHHKTATLCDSYIQPRPAGDFALAMAITRLLFERGLTDPDAAQYCDHLPELRALAESRSLAAWCQEADVEVAVAADLAHRLGVERPAAILVGWGMGRRSNGAAIVRALDALSAITGNLGVAGGGVSFYFKRRGAYDTSFVRGESAAPRTICEPLFGSELLAMRDPPIRAVWITAGNPVAMLPDSNTTAQALRSRELVVVVDSWLSDTAEQATLVLPTTTLLEADDLLGAYGHHYLGVARPVVEPPPTVKSDLQIIQELAARVGLGEEFAPSAREWQRRIAEPKLAAHGITLETIESGAVANPLSPKIFCADRKFKTASGKVNLVHAAPAAPPPADPEYPLQLLSLSTEKSQSSQWPRQPRGPASCTVHPDAAAGIADGALASLKSRLGAMTVRVVHDPAQRRDVALVPKGGHLRDGRCANALIRAATTDNGEGGALYDEPVRLMSLP
ncbi:MAG TPA: molybdopterin-dependent oxidoreductase [Pseudomonadota bacterium]|nr:molybdopterin-dependent oxidoreductase [Pseudomonadota bacterium]